MSVATGTALAIGGIAAGVGESVIQAHSASSAASQQKQAGTAAAATFQPWSDEGLAAYHKAGAMFGLTPGPSAAAPASPAGPASLTGAPPVQTLPQNGTPGATPNGLMGPDYVTPTARITQTGNMNTFMPPNGSAYGS